MCECVVTLLPLLSSPLFSRASCMPWPAGRELLIASIQAYGAEDDRILNVPGEVEITPDS